LPLLRLRSAQAALVVSAVALTQLSASPDPSHVVATAEPAPARPDAQTTPAPAPSIAPPAPSRAQLALEADIHRAAVAAQRIASAEHRKIDAALIDTIARATVASGRRHDIDPLHLVVLGWHESRFRNEVRSSEGACGIVQVMPRERIAGRPTCAQLRDPGFAIEWAAQELASLEMDFAAYAGGRAGRNRTEAVRYGYRHWLSYERLRRELRHLEPNLADLELPAREDDRAASGSR
jgi:soluble lytic murein transglycosylase-like protein